MRKKFKRLLIFGSFILVICLLWLVIILIKRKYELIAVNVINLGTIILNMIISYNEMKKWE